MSVYVLPPLRLKINKLFKFIGWLREISFVSSEAFWQITWQCGIPWGLILFIRDPTTWSYETPKILPTYVYIFLFFFNFQELEIMKQRMEELQTMQNKLAEFFCENSTTFKIEECYKTLANFLGQFSRAVTENSNMREREALRERRTKNENKKKGRFFLWFLSLRVQRIWEISEETLNFAFYSKDYETRWIKNPF